MRFTKEEGLIDWRSHAREITMYYDVTRCLIVFYSARVFSLIVSKGFIDHQAALFPVSQNFIFLIRFNFGIVNKPSDFGLRL